MKISKLAVITALTCCAAFKPCSAQMLVSGDSSSANGSSSSAAFKVFSAANDDDPLDSPTDLFASPGETASPAPAANDTAVPVVNEAPSLANPFDFLSNGNDQRPPAQATGSENAPEPQGLPTDRHHRQQVGQKSMAETILQYGAYQDLPNASYMPVQWPTVTGTMNSSNSIGHYMLRNWCVGGLWSSYPAQRAAQCQAIQNHIAGCAHNHCNRYLMRGGHLGRSARVACGNATCSTCSATAATGIPSPPPPPVATPDEQVQVAPVSVQIPTLAAPIDPQPTKNDSSPEVNAVAQLPAYVPTQQIR